MDIRIDMHDLYYQPTTEMFSDWENTRLWIEKKNKRCKDGLRFLTILTIRNQTNQTNWLNAVFSEVPSLTGELAQLSLACQTFLELCFKLLRLCFLHPPFPSARVSLCPSSLFDPVGRLP